MKPIQRYLNLTKVTGFALVALSLALFAASRRGSATGKYRCGNILVYSSHPNDNLDVIEKFASDCQPGTLTMVPADRESYLSTSWVHYYVGCCIH